tara:strand:- start:136 stop:540 length:405 start_codon:yes stop_codon:yes gene_type:complete
MSVELKIDEIENSLQKNEKIEQKNDLNDSVLKLDSVNVSDAILAAKKLNLDSNKPEAETEAEAEAEVKEEEKVQEQTPVDFNVNEQLIKQLLEMKNRENENQDSSIQEDIKNLTSKVLKKHVLPSLKEFLSKLD